MTPDELKAKIAADHEAVAAAQAALDAANAQLKADLDANPTAPVLSWFEELHAHIDKWPGEASAELHALVTKGKELIAGLM